jgi:predicted nucleotidyltransferase
LAASAVVVPNDEGVEEIERVLRERRPNSQNKDELLKLMADTRSVRFHWIATAKPDVTTVLKKYPRFVDMNAAVSYQFYLMGNICLQRHF